MDFDTERPDHLDVDALHARRWTANALRAA